MTTIRDRMQQAFFGKEMRQLQEMGDALLAAYQEGPYQLPPEELYRQLGEYDASMVQDLIDQLQWDRLGGYTTDLEPQRGRAVQDAERMWVHSTVAQWIVNLWTYYGVGESVVVIPQDEAYEGEDERSAQSMWREFWTADRNQPILAPSRLHDISRQLLVTGNRFFVFFLSEQDGEATIRRIRPEEIVEIVTDPEDDSVPLYYKRQWIPTGGTQQTVYYPDWMAFFNEDLERAELPQGAAVADHNQTTVVVLHTAFRQLDDASLFGWPLLAPAGTPWLRSHREFFQNRLAVSRAKASYVRRRTVTGGSRAVAAVRRTLMSALQSGGATETNPPPVAGSEDIHNKQIQTEELPMGTGAADAKVDGEMFTWMAALSGGVFPHYMGVGDAYRLATACYSNDTEVLTEHGWRGWREVNGDKIATYNHEARRIDYMKPTKLHVYDYQGPMLEIKGRGVDALVTPNHRMLALNENNVSRQCAKTEFEVIRAEDLPSRFALPTQATVKKRLRARHFMLPAIGEGKARSRRGDRQIDMNDWLAFLGWWLAEGWLNHSGRNHTVGLSQHVDSPHVEFIEGLLHRLPFNFNRGPTNGGKGYRWRTNDKALYTWLEENCGKGSASKRLPAFAYSLGEHQSRILLNALWDGDGHHESGQPHYRGCYSSTSKELIDGIQALMVNVGYWGSIKVNREANEHPDFEESAACWMLHMNEQEKRSLARRHNVRQTTRSTTVWCFEAPPNKMFITRRNGCPLIAGNTSMEKPLQMQWTLYRNLLAGTFRQMARIVLQSREKWGGVQYETYEAEVSTDRLVEVDLKILTESVGQIYRDELMPQVEAGTLPRQTLDNMTVYTLQSFLQAAGAADPQEMVSLEQFEGEQPAEMEERLREAALLEQRMDVEAVMQRELQAALEGFGDEALLDVEEEREPDYDKLRLLLLAVLVPLLMRGATESAVERVDEIGIDFDPAEIGALAADWASRYGYELVRGIMGTTRNVIQAAVSQRIVTPGMTTQQLATMLEPAFGAARAQVIAVTETTRAWSMGTAQYRNLLQQVYGLKTREIWYTLLDERVCDICGPLHGQPDSVWGAEFIDGPPAHPNCRCRTDLEVAPSVEA
jgi:hypothetical protein